MRIKRYKLFLESLADDFRNEMWNKMEQNRKELKEMYINLFTIAEKEELIIRNAPDKFLMKFMLNLYLDKISEAILDTIKDMLTQKGKINETFYASLLRVMKDLLVKYREVFINESFLIGASLYAEELSKVMFNVLMEIEVADFLDELEKKENELEWLRKQTAKKESDLSNLAPSELQKLLDAAMDRKDYKAAYHISTFMNIKESTSFSKEEIELEINGKVKVIHKEILAVANAIVMFCEKVMQLKSEKVS